LYDFETKALASNTVYPTYDKAQLYANMLGGNIMICEFGVPSVDGVPVDTSGDDDDGDDGDFDEGGNEEESEAEDNANKDVEFRAYMEDNS
jgi:hypothetical protein